MQPTGKVGFREAPAADMPRLHCVGYVEAVGEGKISQSEKYVVQPISLAPYGSGRKIRVNFLYRPEWMEPGFDPASIEEQIDDEKEANSVLSVYRRNINGHKTISTLRGLAGTDENFAELSNRLLSLKEVSIAGVEQTLREFFEELGNDHKIGYTLKQRVTRTDDVDPETGKNIWVKEPQYDLDTFFDPTEKTMKALESSAAKSNGRVRVCWAGEPF